MHPYIHVRAHMCAHLHIHYISFLRMETESVPHVPDALGLSGRVTPCSALASGLRVSMSSDNRPAVAVTVASY